MRFFNQLRILSPVFILILFNTSNVLFAQTTAADKMAELSFMIGDWKGSSKSYDGKNVKEVTAHEIVQYKLDKHIITIDLESQSLKLHTVIYYDKKERSYFYCPYYKKGTGKYRGQLVDGRFKVSFNNERRLWFQLTPNGEFHEYGEHIKDGQWVTYFEDILPRNTTSNNKP